MRDVADIPVERRFGRMASALFLIAYACSGFASLVYEVAWMRVLSLWMGHATAAWGTVLAAFMGGLAIGSAAGGRAASQSAARAALRRYASLEAVAALAALLVPVVLRALLPILAWAYGDGAPSVRFFTTRLLIAVTVLTIPAGIIGATFPLAARWFADGRSDARRRVSALYAANCVGATAGAIMAGFVSIPAVGVQDTLAIGAAAGFVAAGMSWLLGSYAPSMTMPTVARVPTGPRVVLAPPVRMGIAVFVAAASGAAMLSVEIVWARVLALEVGPTTFAFAATTAIAIVGATAGAAIVGALSPRRTNPLAWVGSAFITAALGLCTASYMAGWTVPLWIAHGIAAAPLTFNQTIASHTLAVASLIGLSALALGAVLPAAICLLGGDKESLVGRVGILYAVNTTSAALSSLVTVFVAIPLFGLEALLRGLAVILSMAAIGISVGKDQPSRRASVVLCLFGVASVVAVAFSPHWNSALVMAGGYKYGAYASSAVDVSSALAAGHLIYQHDGAAATVAVRELTGKRALIIDGKVDASSGSDMLNQKLLAHLPLLLHPNPHRVAVIGLGSGVTLGAALLHPIAQADVLELLPDVETASAYFARENRSALRDQRVRLLRGDGRTHLLLTSQRYDVIISEPSNPWMAGVASLFTREFFEAARAHLAPGGLLCQWTHTYDMSEGDLSSIVATFGSVFPDGTLWLIGRSDLLMIGGEGKVSDRIPALRAVRDRPKVAEDLRSVGINDPSSLWSFYMGGAESIKELSNGASAQVDDRLALEFTGPRAIGLPEHSNSERILAARDHHPLPDVVAAALRSTNASEWRDRGAMLMGAADYGSAYIAYEQARALGGADAATLDGLVRASVASHREYETITELKGLLQKGPETASLWIAASRLLAALGDAPRALAAAEQALALAPSDPQIVANVADLLISARSIAPLHGLLARLEQIDRGSPRAWYYRAAEAYLAGSKDEALALLDEAERLDPRFSRALTLRGAIYAERGQPELANAALTRAIGLDPSDVSSYINLGILMLKAGRADDARARFAEALSLDSHSQAAMRGLTEANALH